jgi:hypothetical protein
MITSTKIIEPSSWGGDEESPVDWIVEIKFADGVLVSFTEEELKDFAYNIRYGDSR